MSELVELNCRGFSWKLKLTPQGANSLWVVPALTFEEGAVEGNLRGLRVFEHAPHMITILDNMLDLSDDTWCGTIESSFSVHTSWVFEDEDRKKPDGQLIEIMLFLSREPCGMPDSGEVGARGVVTLPDLQAFSDQVRAVLDRDKSSSDTPDA